MGEIRVVVGLGNPGRKYAGTRHNIGFMVIDSLAKVLDTEVKRRKFGARFSMGEVASKKLILLKPLRYMNCSGGVVEEVVGFYKVELCHLLVVTDDMALEPGQIRLRAKGSSGGHNGLADVIDKLGANDFSRLRVGIGRSGRIDAYDYVLSRPSDAEKLLLDEAIGRAREAILCWIEHGIEVAMNKFN